MITVFVYGTLRVGGVREIPGLFATAKFLGGGMARGRLHDFGAYPGFVAGGDGAVLGEVYEVDAAALATMDDIERIADDMYRRVMIVVQMDGSAPRMCWVYECNPARNDMREQDVIAGGDWIAHASAKGELPPERWPDEAPIRFGATPPG